MRRNRRLLNRHLVNLLSTVKRSRAIVQCVTIHTNTAVVPNRPYSYSWYWKLAMEEYRKRAKSCALEKNRRMPNGAAHACNCKLQSATKLVNTIVLNSIALNNTSSPLWTVENTLLPHSMSLVLYLKITAIAAQHCLWGKGWRGS